MNELATALDQGLTHLREDCPEYDYALVAAGRDPEGRPVGLVTRKRSVFLQDRVRAHYFEILVGIMYNADYTRLMCSILELNVNALDGQEPPFMNERDFINYGIKYVAKYFNAEISSALS